MNIFLERTVIVLGFIITPLIIGAVITILINGVYILGFRKREK